MSGETSAVPNQDIVAKDIEQIVRNAGTSFYWAMRFQPEEKKKAIFAVYAFCREVDNIADSEAPAKAKLAQLEAWRVLIDQLFKGNPENTITHALSPWLEAFHLKRDAFLAIIDGMEMDALGPIQAPTWKELDLYCARVASAVGLLCIRIFGEPGDKGKELASTLGRALQLTNILRDLKEDADWNRLYLPKELLEKHRISSTEPKLVITNPKLEGVCRELSEEAEAEFRRAEAVIERCNAEEIKPALIMKNVYKKTLKRLQKRGWNPEAVQASESGTGKVVRKFEKLIIALRASVG